MFITNRVKSERARRFASAAHFVEIYNAEMRSLFQLSILLTADAEKAEQCFIGGLEECLSGFDVSMEWARLWTRRAIIKRAITLVKPVPKDRNCQTLTSLQWNSKPANDNLIRAIFSLGAFERFVFVMSLLEHQSDRDCCTLLNCRRRDIESARGAAMKSLPDTETGFNPFEEVVMAGANIQPRTSLRTVA